MAKAKSSSSGETVTRERLAELLNEDLSREYQAIIAYVVYSQVLKGAEYMDIADQLEIARQAGARPRADDLAADRLSRRHADGDAEAGQDLENAKDMLRFDLDNENETVRNYRDRIRQCEALGEFAMAEQIRKILMQEQDHQIDLATALGIEVPDMSKK